jgi:hypothetical protein
MMTDWLIFANDAATWETHPGGVIAILHLSVCFIAVVISKRVTRRRLALRASEQNDAFLEGDLLIGLYGIYPPHSEFRPPDIHPDRPDGLWVNSNIKPLGKPSTPPPLADRIRQIAEPYVIAKAIDLARTERLAIELILPPTNW